MFAAEMAMTSRGRIGTSSELMAVVHSSATTSPVVTVLG
jgi:hypothetical protein